MATYASRSCLRLSAGIQLGWSFVEILEQRRTQPTFEVELRAVIPVATRLLTPPFQLHRVTWKRPRGKQQPKTPLCSRDGGHQPVDHRVDAGNERLAQKSDGRIVEDPQAFILVWHDHSDGVHAVSRCVA